MGHKGAPLQECNGIQGLMADDGLQAMPSDFSDLPVSGEALLGLLSESPGILFTLYCISRFPETVMLALMPKQGA